MERKRPSSCLREHALRHRLREEERPAQVDAHHAVEALLGEFEQVAAHRGHDASVVDQAVQSPECAERLVHDSVVLRGVGDIARDERGARDPAVAASFQVVHHHVEAARGERERDAAAEAAVRAGDQRSGFHDLLRHAIPSP